MHDWILRNPDEDPTAGDDAPAPDADVADLTDPTEDAQTTDEGADGGEVADEAEDVDALFEDVEIDDEDDPGTVQSAAKPSATPTDDAPSTLEEWVEKGEKIDVSALAEAEKAIAADLDAQELPENTAKAMRAVVATVKALATRAQAFDGLVRKSSGASKQQAEIQAERARLAREKAMDDAGLPKTKAIREAVWKAATKAAGKSKDATKLDAKAVLSAAYRKVVGVDLPAPTAKPTKPAPGIRRTPPAANPNGPSKPGAKSSFARTQELLSGT